MLKAGLVLVLMASVPAGAFEAMSGRATVVDGDTVSIEGQTLRMRLYGVDSPESGQTCEDEKGQTYLCGSRAADHLAKLIGKNGRVRCKELDRDRYGRIVAECVNIADGRNLNAAMVRAGWAIEYRAYSDGRYADEEAKAKREKRGLWAGEFVEPSKWRRGERLASEQEGSASAPSCRIKGNISASGKIYHVLGSSSYSKTVIDEARGERWFCSEDEARAAGWRKASSG